MRLNVLLALTLFPLSVAFAQDACTVSTIAGDFIGPAPGDGGPAVDAEIVRPEDVRLGPDGAIYVSDCVLRVIWRIDLDGIAAVFAGSGARGPSGDGGPALRAALAGPHDMAFGPDGSLYFIDDVYVRRIDPQGMITTLAGDGLRGTAEVGVPATSTPASAFVGIAVDAQGLLYAAGGDGHQVYGIGSDGTVRLVAGRGAGEDGRGGFDGDGGPAVDALFNYVSDVEVDSLGRIYVSDRGNRRIRRIGLDGIVETYIGQAQDGLSPIGSPREEITLPPLAWFDIDAADNVIWPSGGVLRRLPPDGVLEVHRTIPNTSRGYLPSVAPDGRTFNISARQVFEITSADEEVHLAGLGFTGPRGDGGPANRALLARVTGLAVNAQGEIFIADEGYARVRKIALDGRMERIAGTGEFTGDFVEGGPAVQSAVRPNGLTLDLQGRVLFSERIGRVLRIEPDGALSWPIGDGINSNRCPNFGNCGNGGPARDSTLLIPDQLASDSLGNLYIREDSVFGPPFWVRRVRPDGTIDNVVTQRPLGDFHGRARAIAVTPDDRLLVATDGRPSTVNDGLDSLWSFTPDDDQSLVPGYEGFLRTARAMAVHPDGDVYLAEFGSAILWRLDQSGRRHYVAGDDFGRGGGDGPIEDLRFSSISTMAFSPDGDLIIADDGNDRILRIRDVAACADDPGPQVALSGLRQGASFETRLAPGTVFSIFGVDLGPEEPATAELDESGFPDSVGGTRVLFDGVPAPMIFAQNGQASGVVPWSAAVAWVRAEGADPRLTDNPVRMVVETEHGRSPGELHYLDTHSPAFFTLDSSGTGLAAALNQDGTVNGPLNPAPPGSVVSLFGTGFGPLDPPGVDGELSGLPLARLATPAETGTGPRASELLYAGPAPGLVSGVTQVNVRLSDQATGTWAFSLTIGGSFRATANVVAGR